DQYATVFLLDKKYYHYAKDLPIANCDYALYLRRSDENRRQITAYLGYGDGSAAFTSQEVELEPQRWYHVAFTYDGAGTGRFFLDGNAVGRMTHENRGAITPGRYGLVLGCRYGSIHAGFPGYIDEVRISNGIVPFFTGSLEVDLAGQRRAFVRMEKDASIPVTLLNDSGAALAEATVRVTLDDQVTETAVPALAAKASFTVDVPVDTSLRPQEYTLRIQATASGNGKTHKIDKAYPVIIVPRPLPLRMPVVMWGSGDFETLKEIGFTHQIVSLVDYDKVWAEGKPTQAMSSGRVAERAETLDQHLIEGLGVVASVSPGRWVIRNAERKEKYQRVNRDGDAYERENPCARFSEVQTFAYNVGASIAHSFGRFPAFQSALIHTEIRDSTDLCFHEHDRAAFRDFAGFDIPDAVKSKAGVRYTSLSEFPENRVIPDDDPILAFYRWFWREGDGWNQLHTQVHNGLKTARRDDLWTFFDPAVRVPSVWGSGGGVDVVSQWTYSYPDPLKIGQATDELFAMANGAPHGQQVMKMTQVIWYRSQTAPEVPRDEAQRAAWEKEIPDARFITIAPDHMREAFWSKISRPIRGIMYHGWGSLVPAQHGSYRFTNPHTREVLTELVDQVVEPLGPTLLQVPDRPSDVALLESFTSQVFARRGTFGWSHNWEADVHLILQWAQIQPRILYDETIMRDGLDGLRVLVLPYCDVLTESVAHKIAEFQRMGGILVADEHLAPALKPDILLSSYRRAGKADVDKTVLQNKAAELRQMLDAQYTRYCDSSNPDVVVRCRQYEAADYVFVVNDKREFGRYVGHHGKVMEKGLPASAKVSVQRNGGHVYDLVQQQSLAAVASADGLAFEVNLDPGAGRVFMITDRAIHAVQIKAPVKAGLGSSIPLEITVVDDADRPVNAIVPVQVTIVDPEGRSGEFSGFYGAGNGRLRIEMTVATNDLPGAWEVRVKELASGRSAIRRFNVE
ncbi:MAG: LamG-like jellyroll fold domain-containing protein, partial [Pirellulaceae bacterium]